jgi:hypothetical protein
VLAGRRGYPTNILLWTGYGLKYYDELNLDSLIGLNEHLVNTNDRVDEIIQAFNNISEDEGWEIQLNDFNRIFSTVIHLTLVVSLQIQRGPFKVSSLKFVLNTE